MQPQLASVLERAQHLALRPAWQSHGLLAEPAAEHNEAPEFGSGEARLRWCAHIAI